jgi:hypothetical protein
MRRGMPYYSYRKGGDTVHRPTWVGSYQPCSLAKNQDVMQSFEPDNALSQSALQ